MVVTEAIAASEVRAAPEVTVVVPTLNERENVRDLVDRIDRVLDGVDWELMFVDDDSPDGTSQVAKAIGRADARIRCIRRIGRRGLAGAGGSATLAVDPRSTEGWWLERSRKARESFTELAGAMSAGPLASGSP